jgi:hypothetical protein
MRAQPAVDWALKQNGTRQEIIVMKATSKQAVPGALVGFAMIGGTLNGGAR